MFGDCERKKLKQIANIGAGQSSPPDNDFTDIGIPFIKAGNLEALQLGDMSEEECKLVDEKAIMKHKLKLHKAGTILIAKSGMSCLSGHVYSLKKDAYIVSHLACIEPVDEKYTKFIKWYFIINGTKNIIKDPSYPSIQISDLHDIEVPEPNSCNLISFNKLEEHLDKSKFAIKEAMENVLKIKIRKKEYLCRMILKNRQK